MLRSDDFLVVSRLLSTLSWTMNVRFLLFVDVLRMVSA